MMPQPRPGLASVFVHPLLLAFCLFLGPFCHRRVKHVQSHNGACYSPASFFLFNLCGSYLNRVWRTECGVWNPLNGEAPTIPPKGWARKKIRAEVIPLVQWSSLPTLDRSGPEEI